MSPPTFNLVDEPWIPVESLEGRVEEVSLAKVFAEAHLWRRIVHPSPLVTFALYRLLFAIFHRAVPIRGSNDWIDLWNDGDAHLLVSEYLERWRHRFDLFSSEAPFWQVPDMGPEHGTMSWAKLAAELNDNNNKVLFDHTRTRLNPPTARPAQVARLLVACQTLSVGAGNSAVGYNVNAVLATTLLVVPEADHLADTLLANARLLDVEDDLPIWELPAPKVGEIQVANAKPVKTFAWRGPASRLTWLTRAIRIEPPADDGWVRTIAFGAGYRTEVPEGDRDPWAAYRVSKDGNWVPQRLDPERGVWRELHAIAVQSKAGEYDVARVFSDLGTLRAADRDVPRTWTLLIGGQAADKAKLEGWGQQRWRMPDVVLRTPQLGRDVVEAIAEAEKTADLLRRLAFRLAGDLATMNPDRKVDRSEQGRLARALPTLTIYWSALERAYALFLLALDGDGDDARTAAEADWLRAIMRSIDASKGATHKVLGRDARSLRAWARVEPRFISESNRRRRQFSALEGGTS